MRELRRARYIPQGSSLSYWPSLGRRCNFSGFLYFYQESFKLIRYDLG
jgi:hypothetical protein